MSSSSSSTSSSNKTGNNYTTASDIKSMPTEIPIRKYGDAGRNYAFTNLDPNVVRQLDLREGELFTHEVLDGGIFLRRKGRA